MDSTPPEGTVLADFEGGTYGDWTKTRDAFGTAPATGTLPDQGQVSGFLRMARIDFSAASVFPAPFLRRLTLTGRGRAPTCGRSGRYAVGGPAAAPPAAGDRGIRRRRSRIAERTSPLRNAEAPCRHPPDGGLSDHHVSHSPYDRVRL